MKKSYLTLNDKLKDSSNYADASGMRFFIDSQKDADMLYGKIRRLTGRDEIRKKAIKIIVKKKLNIPDNLLSTWEDIGDTEMSVEFKYIPKAERDALPDKDFGYVKGVRRLFPVRNQEDLDAAARLIGRAKGLTDADRENVKKKLTAIAKRKKLSIPKTWTEEASMSDTVTIK